MFIFAIAIILYSYSILLIGLLHLLFVSVVLLWTSIFVVVCALLIRYEKRHGLAFSFKDDVIAVPITKKQGYILFIGLFLLIVQCFINFIPVFVPETGFDALWYHLTIPKLYLLNHAVIHIPGGILYYSDMPKLIEMIYVFGLSFGSTVGAKLIHFLFGILCLVVTYKIGRKYFSVPLTILSLVLMSSNLVLSWEMGSAYIDLGRTFFELMALFSFLAWIDQRKKQLFIFSAIFLGAAIATKLIAVGSLAIFLLLLYFSLRKDGYAWKYCFKQSLRYVAITLLIPLPWFIFSLINTGNPIYPFFSGYPITNYLQIFNPLFFLQNFWTIFTSAPDPLSPVYLVALPICFLYWKILYRKFPYIFLYVISSLIIWYITPQTGGGRFILPYLPILSFFVIALFTIPLIKSIKIVLLISILLASITGISYRTVIAKKDLPVVFGKESSQSFLAAHLAFSLGDFADIDEYFAKHIKSTDTVLLYGFHNLYYVDFPFIDNSWAQKGDTFTYIAVQNGTLPNRFKNWQLIYFNPLTHVALYTAGGMQWMY